VIKYQQELIKDNLLSSFKQGAVSPRSIQWEQMKKDFATQFHEEMNDKKEEIT
jgi:hypothetical protein